MKYSRERKIKESRRQKMLPLNVRRSYVSGNQETMRDFHRGEILE